jgi:hypothetical protein
VAVQLGISRGNPIPVRQALDALWKLQVADGDLYGVQTMAIGLRGCMADFRDIRNDTSHPAHEKVLLLDQIIIAGLKKRIDQNAPSIQEDLEQFFMQMYGIRFAKNKEQVNEQYLENLTMVAQKYPEKLWREILSDVAITALGEARDSPSAKRVLSRIKSTPSFRSATSYVSPPSGSQRQPRGL